MFYFFPIQLHREHRGSQRPGSPTGSLNAFVQMIRLIKAILEKKFLSQRDPWPPAGLTDLHGQSEKCLRKKCLFHYRSCCHCGVMVPTITSEELQATTGRFVRQAGETRSHMVITDRGRAVAVLASPATLKPRRRERIIMPGYEELMPRQPGSDLIDDLDAVRGSR